MLTYNMTVHLLCYSMVFIIAWLSKLNKAQNLADDKGILTSRPGYITGAHIAGILWLGIVPWQLLNDPVSQILFGKTIPGNVALFTFIILLTTAVLIIKRQFSNIAYSNKYTNENTAHLSHAFFLLYFIVRIAFLFSYELWFRGYFLFDSISQAGIQAAVILNVFAYVLLHAFKSKKEILACVPFGMTSCFLSILFNAAWPAIVLHISISLVYELNIYRTYSSIILNKPI
jgi:hypothetical protein